MEEERNKKNRKLIALTIFIVVVLGGLILVFLLRQPNIDETEPNTLKAAYSIDSLQSEEFDALSAVLLFNSDTSLAIPTSFRSGHVEKVQFENFLSKTDYGYIINLKSSTPILTPMIIENQLFVSGGFGSKKYFSFDALNGSLNWAVALDDDGPSSAIHSGSNIIFNTESCTIFCLSMATGNMKWSSWLGDPLLSTPVESDGKVYTTYSNYMIHADTTIQTKYLQLKPSHPLICMNSSGKIIWQKWLDGDALCSPVVQKQDLYVTTLSGTVYRIDKNDGEIKACSKLNATSLPTIINDKLFVSRRVDQDQNIEESIAILDLNTLKFMKEINRVPALYLNQKIQEKSELAKKSTSLDAGNGFGSMPITAGGALAASNVGLSNVSSLQSHVGSVILPYNEYVICSMGDFMFCIDPKNESILWKTKLNSYNKNKGGRMNTSPIRAGNKLIVVDLSGDVKLFNISTGKLQKTYSLNCEVRNQPIVSKGKIFVPSTNGTLHCIETGDNSIDGWNMFMKNSSHSIN